MSNKRYQWRNDNNQWVDFAPDVSADLLAAFSRGDSTTEINVPNRGVYIINFSDMRQIQKTNAHRWRRIRYTEDQSSYSKHSSSNNQSGHNSQPTSPQATTRSPGDDIFVAAEYPTYSYSPGFEKFAIVPDPLQQGAHMVTPVFTLPQSHPTNPGAQVIKYPMDDGRDQVYSWKDQGAYPKPELLSLTRIHGRPGQVPPQPQLATNIVSSNNGYVRQSGYGAGVGNSQHGSGGHFNVSSNQYGQNPQQSLGYGAGNAGNNFGATGAYGNGIAASSFGAPGASANVGPVGHMNASGYGNYQNQFAQANASNQFGLSRASSQLGPAPQAQGGISAYGNPPQSGPMASNNPNLLGSQHGLYPSTPTHQQHFGSNHHQFNPQQHYGTNPQLQQQQLGTNPHQQQQQQQQQFGANPGQQFGTNPQQTFGSNPPQQALQYGAQGQQEPPQYSADNSIPPPRYDPNAVHALPRSTSGLNGFGGAPNSNPTSPSPVGGVSASRLGSFGLPQPTTPSGHYGGSPGLASNAELEDPSFAIRPEAINVAFGRSAPAPLGASYQSTPPATLSQLLPGLGDTEPAKHNPND